MRVRAAGFVLAALALQAENQTLLEDCLAAVARTAANFAATAPGLMAEETLDQRGRRGFVEILRGKKDRIKDLRFTLPDDFRSHHVISQYSLQEIGEPRALHEIRTVVSLDGEAFGDRGEARHALTIGVKSGDDDIKRRLLENLDRNQLEGAVTDFGQLILLFTKSQQQDYTFSAIGDQRVGDEALVVLKYRQVAGSHGLMFFRQTTAQSEPASGQIWLRARDLLPLRITFNTEEFVSPEFRIRTEAAVDYTPSPFGLIPAKVSHKQFLNSELMVENDLHYADFHRTGVMIP